MSEKTWQEGLDKGAYKNRGTQQGKKRPKRRLASASASAEWQKENEQN